MAGITRRMVMSPIPMTIQLSMGVVSHAGRRFRDRGSLRIAGQPKAPLSPQASCRSPQKIKGRLVGRPSVEKELKLLLGGDRVLGGLGRRGLQHGLRLCL